MVAAGVAFAGKEGEAGRESRETGGEAEHRAPDAQPKEAVPAIEMETETQAGIDLAAIKTFEDFIAAWRKRMEAGEGSREVLAIYDAAKSLAEQALTIREKTISVNLRAKIGIGSQAKYPKNQNKTRIRKA